VTALIDIHPDDLRSPGEVLAAAFHDDPTLRWCFGGDEPGFEGRLRGYLELGHRWHTGVGHPVHGVRAGDVLVGAAYAILPDIEITPPQVAALRAALVERCGQPWATRFTDYNERVEVLRPDGRFHGIALVGVLPEWQGRGLGARMVDRVSALCDADPRSEGVLLDTATDDNVRFYEARGFHPVAEVAFDGFVERVMLRPRNPTRPDAV
jgi:GNAT superfamily N-acetyltransferase